MKKFYIKLSNTLVFRAVEPYVRSRIVVVQKILIKSLAFVWSAMFGFYYKWSIKNVVYGPAHALNLKMVKW